MGFEIILQLLLVTILGALVGLEMEIKKRETGLKTFSLVCLGSCVFTVVIFCLLEFQKIDVGRVIEAVAIGIGFVGAGTIFKSEGGIEGLTTAAGLWLAAATGVAIGARFYLLALLSTLFGLLILTGFGILKKKFF